MAAGGTRLKRSPNMRCAMYALIPTATLDDAEHTVTVAKYVPPVIVICPTHQHRKPPAQRHLAPASEKRQGKCPCSSCCFFIRFSPRTVSPPPKAVSRAPTIWSNPPALELMFACRQRKSFARCVVHELMPAYSVSESWRPAEWQLEQRSWCLRELYLPL